MATKIINYLTNLINDQCQDENFISNWAGDEKNIVLEMIKALDKKTSNKKKKKDKNAPKKNVSTWILFSKSERLKVKKDFPDMPPKEVMAELAKRWKIAKEDDDAMEEFKILAEEDKKRYEEEKKNYVPPENEEEEDYEEVKDKKKGKKGKKKVAKVPGQPKKPKSSWLFFCEEERKNLKDEEDAPKGKDVLAELAARWKALKEKGGKKYNKFDTMAKNDKERYAEDMKNFNEDKKDEDDYDEATQEFEAQKYEEDEVTQEFEAQKEDSKPIEEEKPLPKKRGRKKAVNKLDIDNDE